MPARSRLKLPALNLGSETVGERLARIRKERGYTQVELAEKMGLIQALVSAYERNRLRLHAEMLTRFALAIEVSADELLGLLDSPKRGAPPRRVRQRLEMIESLPPEPKRALLKTIDTFLEAAQK